MKIELTAEAKDWLLHKGYNPSFGARPLRRTMQRYIEDYLAEEVIKGHFQEGSIIKVSVAENKLIFKDTRKTVPALTSTSSSGLLEEKDPLT